MTDYGAFVLYPRRFADIIEQKTEIAAAGLFHYGEAESLLRRAPDFLPAGLAPKECKIDFGKKEQV